MLLLWRSCAFSSSHSLTSRRCSSHLAIVVMEFVLFVATNIEPPYVFPHAFVYDGTVSVVATLGIIKVAAIASSMVMNGAWWYNVLKYARTLESISSFRAGFSIGGVVGCSVV